jgi:hypothetical protein
MPMHTCGMLLVRLSLQTMVVEMLPWMWLEALSSWESKVSWGTMALAYMY